MARGYVQCPLSFARELRLKTAVTYPSLLHHESMECLLGRFASKAPSLLPVTSQGPCALCSFGVKSLNHEGSSPPTSFVYVYALGDNTDVTQKGGGCRVLWEPPAHMA